MRAGTEAALARVVNVFGAARPHHAYLFANRRANRMKVLVHDGIGVWLAARRLQQRQVRLAQGRGRDADADAARSSMRWCSACRGSASARPASSACCRRIAQLRNVPMCAGAHHRARSRSVIDTTAPRPAGPAATARACVAARLRSRQGRAARSATARSRSSRPLIDKLTHEMAVLKRLKFAARSEAFNAEQKSLLEETLDADLAALQRRARQASCPAQQAKGEKQTAQAPGAAGAPAAPRDPPRAREHHLQLRLRDASASARTWPRSSTTSRACSPSSATCAASGSARSCETLVQAPVAPHIIDKGIPTTGLLAQVLVAKFLDHLPLYRQEAHLRARRAWRSRARRWRSGWASAACSCSRWWTRWRHELLRHDGAARRRDAGGDAQAGQRQDAPGLPVELLHDAASTRSRRWSSTSPTAAAAQHVRDFLGLATASAAGRASSCATTSAATRPASSWA